MKIIINTKSVCDGQIISETSEAKCRLFDKNGTWYVVYKEGNEFFKNTTTTIKLKGGHASVIRTGDVPGKLVIEEGKLITSAYDTGTGVLEMGISGKKVYHNLSETGGEICLVYEIFGNEIELMLNID